MITYSNLANLVYLIVGTSEFRKELNDIFNAIQ
jgi:hypothetical protein